MKAFAALALVLALPMCQPAATPTAGTGTVTSGDTGLEGFDPDLVETERKSCEARGGQFGKGGIRGRFVCFEPTPDAGQSCTAESDCTTVCLARSQTCAPIQPFFGCQDVLPNAGRVATLCVD